MTRTLLLTQARALVPRLLDVGEYRTAQDVVGVMGQLAAAPDDEVVRVGAELGMLLECAAQVLVEAAERQVRH